MVEGRHHQAVIEKGGADDDNDQEEEEEEEQVDNIKESYGEKKKEEVDDIEESLEEGECNVEEFLAKEEEDDHNEENTATGQMAIAIVMIKINGSSSCWRNPRLWGRFDGMDKNLDEKLDDKDEDAKDFYRNVDRLRILDEMGGGMTELGQRDGEFTSTTTTTTTLVPPQFHGTRLPSFSPIKSESPYAIKAQRKHKEESTNVFNEVKGLVETICGRRLAALEEGGENQAREDAWRWRRK
ncbi:hypothetical protein DFH27DRAFT_656792 [Peziza echinospora]|nr:hypothetical protein DFH27DRAFT_656792 [Peziza echinospora]